MRTLGSLLKQASGNVNFGVVTQYKLLYFNVKRTKLTIMTVTVPNY